MEKKSQTDDDDEDLKLAREALSIAVKELSTVVPILTLMWATGEALVQIAAALMAIDQEANGSTKNSLTATVDLLRLLREECEHNAVKVLTHPPGHTVH